MSEQSLNRRREDLIKRIREIDDEDLLISLEDKIYDYQEGNSAMPIPGILREPDTVEGLRSLIDQVLEEDRKGMFVDGEEFLREMDLKYGMSERAGKKKKWWNEEAEV